MKKALVLILGVCFVALLIGSVAARDARIGARPTKAWEPYQYPELNVDQGLRGLYQEAAANTLCLAWYTFETEDWQGWTRLDLTSIPDTMFHVDDFSAVGSGNMGHLRPIEGNKSMWCGARYSDPVACGWEFAPGYGNNWLQVLGTDAFTFTGQITLKFHAWYDSEAGYDYTRVQYDLGGGNWADAAVFDGRGDTVTTCLIGIPKYRTKLRFRFNADSGYSDQDGEINTDGAFVVDSISVFDEGVLNNLETFETCAVDAKACGIWQASQLPGFGMYSGLAGGAAPLQDKDPCGDNFATQVVFFIGSTEISTDYPGLYNTPWCAGATHRDGPCQNEMIISPEIDMTRYSTACNEVQDADIDPGILANLGGATLRFTVYRDLPLGNLVFYTWGVRNWNGTCWTSWQDDGWVYYGDDKDFIFQAPNISPYVGSDPIQIGIGVFDACEAWYNRYGRCTFHTPSPWFDNVRLERFETFGPQWAIQDIDQFQDNFPSNAGDIESTSRCDQGNDIRPEDNPVIDPGDSMVVVATSKIGGGIGVDGTFGGPAVYLHVKATCIGPDAGVKLPLHGAGLCGSVAWGGGTPGGETFNMISDDGTWTVIQCDSARSATGTAAKDTWMVDLNDELFTRGYKIEYYFTAVDGVGKESAFPRWARSYGPYYEWTVLPTLNSDVLYVDDCDGRGGGWDGAADYYWQSVFANVLSGTNALVDRYDTQGPSSGVSDGLGSRVKGNQLIDNYMKIIWDSGELNSVTICSGTADSDKSNDAYALDYWMQNSEHKCGLWVLGEGVAEDLDYQATGGAADALTLLSTDCGVVLIDPSYFEKTGGREGGGVVVPLIKGDPEAGIFVHGGVPDQFYAYGGCAIINGFDVIDKTANGKRALDFPPYLSTPYYAGISSEWTNGSGDTIRTMWFTMSMQYIRDDTLITGVPLDRYHLAADVFTWMDNDIKEDITPAYTPKSNKLAQNFPNPFNPSTSIKYDVKDKGVVTLKVYNVAGQLIRTLVNGVKDAGSYTITWDGKNDRGGAVASGIYFYKMDTKNFSQTKKMVMLR
jgi:hypothetical protein